MEKEQKERLKQELRFLKESLEADVISRDEYEKGKERIQKKLDELEPQKEDEPVEEIEIREIMEKPTKIIGADFEEKEELKAYEEEPRVEEAFQSEKEESEENLEETFAQKEEQEEPQPDEPESYEESFKEEGESQEKEESYRAVPVRKEEEQEESLKEARESEYVEEEYPIREEEKEEEPEELQKEEQREEEPEEAAIEEKSPLAPDEEPIIKKEEEIVFSKKWIYGIALIIIAVILFFLIRSCSTSPETPIPNPEEIATICLSDSDCKEEGMVGTCINPGEKGAKCEFQKDVKTKLFVINDKSCMLCDPKGTKSILAEMFPNADLEEIDSKTTQGQKLIQDLGLTALPSYVFDANVSDTINFAVFKTALNKVKSSYVMTNTAAGAVYYFKRPEMKNKLDFYLVSGDNQKIESAIKEVQNLFKDKIEFAGHTVAQNQKPQLEKELGINTYPSFLLNNQFVFRGVLPANIIKEKICEVNYFKAECGANLSKI